MEWMFWIFSLSEYVLCDHITTIVQTIYTYRPDLLSASVYENDGYNSFGQRFCTPSISFDIFIKPGCQAGHAYSRIERTMEQ